MHPLIRGRHAEIVKLCRELGVQRLDLFGSALGDEFDVEHSDVDVLADFDTATEGSFDTYFRLKDGLERILGRPVDVVTARGIRNPYFRAQVLATRELLYAA
ncbi:MAG: nucleotidyltransferase family protein [Pseudonocardia sp.]